MIPAFNSYPVIVNPVPVPTGEVRLRIAASSSSPGTCHHHIGGECESVTADVDLMIAGRWTGQTSDVTPPAGDFFPPASVAPATDFFVGVIEAEEPYMMFDVIYRDAAHMVWASITPADLLGGEPYLVDSDDFFGNAGQQTYNDFFSGGGI